MKGILKKGFVKYSLVVLILALCVVLFSLYGPVEGRNESDDTGLKPVESGITGGGPSVEVMGFNEIGDGNEEPEEMDEPVITGTSSPTLLGGFSVGGSSGGSSGSSVQFAETHKVCDFKNEQCIVVDGPGTDECANDEDCYCDPKTPGYWKNHLGEAGGVLQYQDTSKGDLTLDWGVGGNEISYGTVRAGGFRGSGYIITPGSSGTLATVTLEVIRDGYEGNIDLCITNYVDDIGDMMPEPYCISSCQKNIVSSPNIYITCSPDSGGPGTTVTVPISIDGNTQTINAFGLDLIYDIGLLRCVHENYDVFDYVETSDNITHVLECEGNCSSMFKKLKKFLLATILNICADYFDLDDAHNGKTIEYWIEQSIAEVENGESELDEYYSNVLDDVLNGELECNPDYHTECNYFEETCDLVLGSGGHECGTFDDCTHTECNYQALTCDTLQSPGTNECLTFDDCPRHAECDYQYEACSVVEGSGENQCLTWYDCIHTECYGMSCVGASSPGTDECVTDYDCYYMGCVDMTCVPLVGQREDECVTDYDCGKDCIPPYLGVDKETNPTELVCEETTITLEIEGKGEPCKGFYPVDVVLVFDNSGSMDDDGWDDNISDWQPIGDAKIAAKTFVDLLGSNDKAGLVSFNTMAHLDQGLTLNKNAVKSAISGMDAGGWTNMSNGLELANQELIMNGRVDVPWIEILLSDGNNNCGVNDPPADCHDRVFARAQEAADEGIIIYTIALGDNSNQSLMQDIADMTGGDFYYAPTSGDLEDIYEEIAENVTNIAGTNVIVMDYLPSYADLNESTLPGDCEYNHTDGKITCVIDIIHINQTVSFSFNVYINQYGYLLTNVYPDSGVEYVNHNQTTVFEEFPETHVTVLGCQHKVCNYIDMICETVTETEPGEDECQTFEDCPHHKICDYQQQACAIVQGTGQDECSSYDDCVHMECCDMSCVVSDFPGTDECSTDRDCYYYACEEMSCVAVEGSGTDECETDSDCIDYVCEDISCVAVSGTGEVQCTDDDDCRHYECDYVNELCKAVAEDGTDECSVWEDCAFCGNEKIDPGEECELPGTGNNLYCSQTTSECSGNKLGTRDAYGNCDSACGCVDDPFSYSCVEGQCGAECDEDTDCPCPKDGCYGTDWYEYPEHGVCTDDCMCDVDETPCDGPCKPIITNDDPRCTRYICDYVGDSCKLVEGDGVDECVTFDDCERHKICNYDSQACVIVEGPGEDQCLNWDDCTHTECCDMSCNVVSSQGIDECVTDADCIDYVCEGMSCISVAGTGEIECTDDYDCTDYVCNYDTLTCDAVAGSGFAECTTFEDCPQHTECDYVGQACAVVQGSGTDECVTYDDCFHDICDYSSFTCDEEPTTTPGDPCVTNDDCFEKVCDYEKFVCKKVEPGTPGTSCNTWEDCAFCGDGQVSLNEECELPGTGNNLYCSQTTSECSGNKLGTRDAYGNCDSACGCVDDPFSYSCVEGQCGAECGSDDDCDCPADGCDVYNHKYPTYFDFPDYSECFTDSCTCADCEPAESICDPRCMGDCEVYVRLEHDQGNRANYDQYVHNPSGGTYDITIVVESNGECDGWRIPIRYWWCQCPGFNPDQEDIEYSVWPPKWNRLCTTNAGNPNTDSLYCAPCETRKIVADYRSGDDGSEIRIDTNVGVATGTYQIDIVDYHDCYGQKAAVALGCAGHLEDTPQ